MLVSIKYRRYLETEEKFDVSEEELNNIKNGILTKVYEDCLEERITNKNITRSEMDYDVFDEDGNIIYESKIMEG